MPYLAASCNFVSINGGKAPVNIELSNAGLEYRLNDRRIREGIVGEARAEG